MNPLNQAGSLYRAKNVSLSCVNFQPASFPFIAQLMIWEIVNIRKGINFAAKKLTIAFAVTTSVISLQSVALNL